MERVSVKETNLFFLIFMLGYISLALAIGNFLPADCPVWLNMIISDVVVLTPIVCIMFYKRISPLEAFKFSKVGIRDFVVTYIAAYTLLPVISFINSVTMLFAKNYVTDMVMDVYEYPLLVQLILIAVMPAVVEELIFRGFFYGSFRKRSLIGGALMSGLFFGIAHMNINQFAYAFVIGVAFCVLYEVTDNILIPITAHFAINANTILMLAFLEEDVAQTASTMYPDVATEMTMDIMIMVLPILLLFSYLGLLAFRWIVQTLAKWHNKSDVLIKRPFINGNSEERFIDVYFVVAVVPLVIYMILLEMNI